MTDGLSISKMEAEALIEAASNNLARERIAIVLGIVLWSLFPIFILLTTAGFLLDILVLKWCACLAFTVFFLAVLLTNREATEITELKALFSKMKSDFGSNPPYTPPNNLVLFAVKLNNRFYFSKLNLETNELQTYVWGYRWERKPHKRVSVSIHKEMNQTVGGLIIEQKDSVSNKRYSKYLFRFRRLAINATINDTHVFGTLRVGKIKQIDYKNQLWKSLYTVITANKRMQKSNSNAV